MSAESYHAGLEDREREEIQTKWIDDQINVVCATVAFGEEYYLFIRVSDEMKSNVFFCLHRYGYRQK